LNRVHDGGQKGKKGSHRTVAACFGSLRNDDVGTKLRRFPRRLHSLHLQKQLGPGTPHSIHERSGIAERKHDRRRLPRQRDIEPTRIACQVPGDEPNADALSLRDVEFTLDPRRVGVAWAEHSEAPGARHRSGEASSSDGAHWGEHDWVLDRHQAGEPRR
jgi:hypothetical protein